MKIVNLEEFRCLPRGTVYSRYKPIVFSGLEIKEETWETDFIYINLIGNIESCSSEVYNDKLIEAEENGTDVGLDFASSDRDGLYEKDQLFAIYSKADLELLIFALSDCLERGYK